MFTCSTLQNGEEQRDEEEQRTLTRTALGGDQQELLSARQSHTPVHWATYTMLTSRHV